ncbi:MAG: CcmD family protein [Chloroflexi bacterium]|nr:CcmD family protein [Chloroflexota bacterium]
MIYLFSAYTVIWLALFFYLFTISRRQRDLERDIDILQQVLESENS